MIKLVRQANLQIIFKQMRLIFRKTLIIKFGFELVARFGFFFFCKFLCEDFIDESLKRFSAIKDLRFLFPFLKPAILLSFFPFYSYSGEVFSKNRIICVGNWIKF